MEQLKNFEKKKVQQMENWGTYRQSDGSLISFNPISGRGEPVRSFCLESIPRFDALLLFGGYVRPVKYAALIMQMFKNKYGYYPEFLTVGGRPNKGQKAAKAENVCYEEMMIQLGFGKDMILSNHIDCSSTSTKENEPEIVRAAAKSMTLAMLERPRIAVVTASGYSLRAAQELCYTMPQFEFIFFETPIATENERMFQVETFEGYYVDIIIASCWHSLNQQSWCNERLALTGAKVYQAPLYADIKHLAAKGYTYYMYDDMMRQLGFSAEESFRLRNERKIEITGTDLDGNQCGEGWPGGTEIFRSDLVEKFIEQINEDFIRRGIFIG